jgi:hypothetical protein
MPGLVDVGEAAREARQVEMVGRFGAAPGHAAHQCRRVAGRLAHRVDRLAVADLVARPRLLRVRLAEIRQRHLDLADLDIHRAVVAQRVAGGPRHLVGAVRTGIVRDRQRDLGAPRVGGLAVGLDRAADEIAHAHRAGAGLDRDPAVMGADLARQAGARRRRRGGGGRRLRGGSGRLRRALLGRGGRAGRKERSGNCKADSVFHGAS